MTTCSQTIFASSEDRKLSENPLTERIICAVYTVRLQKLVFEDVVIVVSLSEQGLLCHLLCLKISIVKLSSSQREGW